MSEDGRKKGRGAVAISLCSLLVSIVALIYPAPARDWVDSHISPVFPNDRDVPLQERIEVRTSGYRQDLTGAIHSGDNLVDGKSDTAWAECGVSDAARRVSERRNPCDEPKLQGVSLDSLCTNPQQYAPNPTFQGIGEWVELVMTAQTHLKALTILNGFQATDALFTRNPRVKKLRVDADGSFVEELNLEDKKGSQRFDLDVTAKNIRLTIEDTYLGSCIHDLNGQWLPYFYDTSMSDVSLIPANLPTTRSSTKT